MSRSSHPHKDLRPVLDALEDSGYEVTRTRRGHYKAICPGRSTLTFGASGDWRAIRNIVALLRRNGVKVA